MILRKDDTWTTIQCKQPKCGLCFKVLNDRFAMGQTCPYCLQPISLHEQIKKQEARKSDFYADEMRL